MKADTPRACRTPFAAFNHRTLEMAEFLIHEATHRGIDLMLIDAREYEMSRFEMHTFLARHYDIIRSKRNVYMTKRERKYDL